MRAHTYDVPGRVLCRSYENDEGYASIRGRRDIYAAFDNRGGGRSQFKDYGIEFTYRHYMCSPSDGNWTEQRSQSSKPRFRCSLARTGRDMERSD